MVQVNRDTNYSRVRWISTCLHGDGHATLYNADTGREKHINNTALWIWKRLDGSISCRQLARELAAMFGGVPVDDVERDVSSFVIELLEEGYADVHDPVGLALMDEEYHYCSDRPGSFDLSLTGKCNLHCEYCFYANEMHGRPDLSREEWFRFFDELGGLAVRDLTLSGGEVFVRPDLFELIDRIIDNRMRFCMLSNGTLINEKILENLEKGKRRQRLNYIQISIDGSRSEIHDRSRGAGSFDKALSGLKLLKEAGFPLGVRVTINKYNVDDLENIAGLLLEDIGLPSIGTNDAIPMGSGCENQGGITLSPKQQLEAILKMHELDLKYPGRIQASAGPLSKWRTYGEMEHARATGEKSTRYQMGFLTACGCMFNKLSVHHDGVISPCNMLPDLEMGRINQVSIKEIWKTSRILKDLKARRQIPMTEVPDCRGCEWLDFCNGSCPGLPYTETGDFNRANLHDCYRRFLKGAGLESPNVPWANTADDGR